MASDNRRHTVMAVTPKLESPLEAKPPLLICDPEGERRLLSLVTRSEICSEENAVRLANRQYGRCHSDVLPGRRQPGVPAAGPHGTKNPSPLQQEVKQEEDDSVEPSELTEEALKKLDSAPPGGINLSGDDADDEHEDPTAIFTLSARTTPSPQPTQETSLPADDHPIVDNLPIPAEVTADQLSEYAAQALKEITTGLFKPFKRSPGTSKRVSTVFNMTGYMGNYPLEENHPIPEPDFPASSYAALEANRARSIRVVKPDYTVGPTGQASSFAQAQQGESSTMYGNTPYGQKSQKIPTSQSRGKSVAQPSYTGPRNENMFKAPFGATENYGRGRGRGYSAGSAMMTPTGQNTHKGAMGHEASRGRSNTRYEFLDSDDDDYMTTPAMNATKKGDAAKAEGVLYGQRESSMTTLADMLDRASQAPGQALDVKKSNHHPGDGLKGLVPSVSQPNIMYQQQRYRRPLPLALRDCTFVDNANQRGRAAQNTQLKNAGPASSVYDDDNNGPPDTTPIVVPQDGEFSGLKLYQAWKEDQDAARVSSQGTIRIGTSSNEGRGRARQIEHVRSRSALGVREDMDHRYSSELTGRQYSASNHASGLVRSATVNDVNSRRNFSDPFNLDGPPTGTALFSPLTPFLMKMSGAPSGTGPNTKKMIGENGWLEDTAASTVPKPKADKSGRFIEHLKRVARGIADNATFKQTRGSRATPVNPIKISLDPREQSLLYCELEYGLSNAIEAYIKLQLNSGRLDAGKLSRIADAWSDKGRPKVVGFRYDLETQVELIAAHLNNFRFYGPLAAEGTARILGLLHAMKMNARCMRIRTYCQPDSLIAKHVVDAQNFLQLLGTLESMQRPLEEIAQFLKAAVDRRKAMDAAPPGGQGDRRAVSENNVRKFSDNSEQRVRFNDDNGGQTDHYANMPGASKSHVEVRGQSYGQQVAQSRGESHRPAQQRQYREGSAAASKDTTGQGRYYHAQ